MPGPYPLPHLSATIDATGITAPPFEDILASLTASYQQIYGSDAYLAPDSQDGQWLAIQAQAIYDSNQALIAGYLAYSPSFAQGIGLSSVVKINGLRRRTPSYSTVEIQLVGQAGTIIDNGSVGDPYGHTWNLPPHVVIPLSGDITVTATCTNPGAIVAEPNTVTDIQTPVPGWQTATNPASAFAGAPVENDAQLRRRQTYSTSLPAITPRESIHAAVANVPGVGRTDVIENDTDFYSPELIPPHSIAIVVEAGNAADIAAAVALKKNTGCGTYGDFQYTHIDAHGVPLPVNWFYLQGVPIYVAIRIEPLSGYLNTTGELIIQVVAAFIQNSFIGEEVYPSKLMAPADLAGDVAVAISGMSQYQLDALSQTYVVREILISTAPAPTESEDITISFYQAPTCNVSNVSMQVYYS